MNQLELGMGILPGAGVGLILKFWIWSYGFFTGNYGSWSLLRYFFYFSNYLISQIFLLLLIITLEPETPAGHPKYQKTQIVA